MGAIFDHLDFIHFCRISMLFVKVQYRKNSKKRAFHRVRFLMTMKNQFFRDLNSKSRISRGSDYFKWNMNHREVITGVTLQWNFLTALFNSFYQFLEGSDV